MIQYNKKLDCLNQDEKIENLPDLINRFVYNRSGSKDKNKIQVIFDALRILLNENYEKYIFTNENVDAFLKDNIEELEFQNILSNINEKQIKRKSKGVYYTPTDVIEFIFKNCVLQNAIPVADSGFLIGNETELRAVLNERQIENFLYNMTVFDPTCGSGEFLICSVRYKFNMIAATARNRDRLLLQVLSTIYGNDINVNSVELTKIRLFFETIKHMDDVNFYETAASILNDNFECQDFININTTEHRKFDSIIGNPPYVEDSRSEVIPEIRYGNIYANVLHNSIDLLNPGGNLGVIIPISYLSTPRMEKIRSYMQRKTSSEMIISYADRPDCLFTAVHQKLSIVFAKSGEPPHRILTSGYHYWYKNERNQLFKRTELVDNQYTTEEFYPKLGNPIDCSIYQKVHTKGEDNLLSNCRQESGNAIFLNVRAAFWIKSLTQYRPTKEYKEFHFQKHSFIYCLLNSSLFFWFWVMVSDCWHITKKELQYFYVPQAVEDDSFIPLKMRLEEQLEATKVYVGTCQTEYEYKHKHCKAIIDEIDEALANIYGLTDEEVRYIKEFAVKYRESRG